MNNVNYKVLKANVLKSCEATKDYSLEFKIDFDKLTTLVGDINLTPIAPVGEVATRVKEYNIPFLSEYFEKTHLSWFTKGKFFTIITFIDSEFIDETAQELLDNIKKEQVEDPDNDKINAMATLVANYPCYFTVVVSYQNDAPNRIGRPSYELACRANKVVIKHSDYQYNPKDFS